MSVVQESEIFQRIKQSAEKLFHKEPRTSRFNIQKVDLELYLQGQSEFEKGELDLSVLSLPGEKFIDDAGEIQTLYKDSMRIGISYKRPETRMKYMHLVSELKKAKASGEKPYISDFNQETARIVFERGKTSVTHPIDLSIYRS